MATSGTATFNLDIHEIIEEAYERAGLGRAFSGNDFRTARRSLNLLAQDFFKQRYKPLDCRREDAGTYIRHGDLQPASRYS